MYELLKSQFRGDKTASPLREMRQSGWVPGTVFGKGFDPVSFKVEHTQFKKFLAHSGKIFKIEVQGHGTHLVNVDNIQYDHLGNNMLHASFHKISENVETTAELPILLTGTAIGINAGGVIQQTLQSVQVKGLPKDFPEHIEVDITNLDVHNHFGLSDITPPKGLSWAHEISDSIVSCHTPKLNVVADTEEVTPEVVGEEAAPVEEVTEEKKAS